MWRSCHGQTSQGTAACGGLSPCVPSHSTWPALPGLRHATENNNSSNNHTDEDNDDEDDSKNDCKSSTALPSSMHETENDHGSTNQVDDDD